MRILTASLMAAMAAAIASSSFAEDHFYFGPQLNYQMWDESRFVPGFSDDNGVALGFNVGYEFAESYAAELVAKTSMSDLDTEAYEVNLYNFLSRDRSGVTPYIVAGFSNINISGGVVHTESTNNISVGLGLSRYLSDVLELRTDVRLTNSLDDNLAAGDNVVDLGITAALNYHFGSRSASRPVVAPLPTTVPVASAAPARAAAPAPMVSMPVQTRTISVELEVLFAFDSAQVQNVFGTELAEMADALNNQEDLELVLEGHSDSVGGEAYNQQLSQRRVDAVKAQLVNDYGVSASRIEAIGYGESRPVADNSTAAGRAENRRVVGVISFEAAQ